MTIIYFIRHGEYKNPNNIVPWRLPHFPLSDEGIKNINKDADYFKDKKIEVIYSSPILRAKQSAKIIGKKLSKKVIISSLISEVHTPLQNRHLSYEEFYKRKVNIFFDEFHVENNGESIDKIFLRVNKLVKKVYQKHDRKNIIFVSHGDPIMIYSMIKRDIKVKNGDLMHEKYYIPKAGIIRVEIKNKRVIDISPINY